MISIVLPAYNEQDNIPYIKKELFPVLNKLNYKYEVLFIDDGSKDKTVERVNKLMKNKSLTKNKGKIRLVKHAKNKGLGAAIKTGIKNAKGNLMITMDSDLTFHPKYIPKLLKKFEQENVDCVIGSPTLMGYDKNIPFYRIFLSKGVNTLYNIILGRRITSVSPIFRLYKTKQLKELRIQSNKFEINAEILAKLIFNKKKIIEIPAKLTVRKYGESKLNNIAEIKNHLRLLSKTLYWRITK